MVRATRSLDPDIASAAALIGDPSRARILCALADGRARPAGELARVAGVSPPTASSHLDRLFRAHLLAVEVQGRHHYYRLRNAHIGELLEVLALTARSPRALSEAQSEASRALRFARTCYSHLAGTLGVRIREALCDNGYLCESDVGYAITPAARAWFRRLEIEVESLRRPLTRPCLDWSERRHHLAGALGVALAKRMFELGWLARIRDSRAVRMTDLGHEELTSRLGIDFPRAM